MTEPDYAQERAPDDDIAMSGRVIGFTVGAAVLGLVVLWWALNA